MHKYPPAGLVVLCNVRNMGNPFEYGSVVSGEAFCNREKETGDLVRAMENGERLFVFSERRYGKTSLVRDALGKCSAKLRKVRCTRYAFNLEEVFGNYGQ